MPRWFWHPQRPKTSADVFQVEQQLWGVLAGDRALYWRNRAVEPQRSIPGTTELYTSLGEQRRDIRLLKVTHLVQSDAKETTFAAQLVHSALDDSPTYLAISYAWGEQSIVGHFVDPDGVKTPLGYSQVILDIVSTLVPPGGTLHLWIDAVCINQEDPDERASQVAIMGDIYRQAQQVIVFLGTADDASTRAMDLLQLTRGFIQANGDVLPALSVEEFEKRSLGAGISPASWAAVAQLLSRPWFTRCWVVQEVALASDVVAVCGRHAVRWDELCQLCQQVSDKKGLLFKVMEKHLGAEKRMAYLVAPFRNPPSIAVARDLQRAEKDPSILQHLLLRFRHFQTTDPRDKIFALLGLALPTDKVNHDLRPNYRIAVEDLYIQVARRILLRDSEVLILAAAGVGHRRSLRLPSWVPDWTSLTDGTTLGEIAAAGNYHATEQGMRPVVSYDPQFPMVLTIKGCIVDTISKLSSERLPLGRGGRLRYVQDSVIWVEEVLIMTDLNHTPEIEQSQDSARRQAQRTSLWKTLTASGPTTSPHTVGLKRGQQQQQQRGKGPPTERGFDNWLAERRECAAKGSLDGLRLDRAAREEVSGLAYHSDRATRGRRIFVSAAGHLGLAAAGAEVGDVICVFPGIRTPFAIRKAVVGDVGCPAGWDYVLVGEVYHYGIVSGALEACLPSTPIRLI